MQELAPLDIQLSGLNLIEASAGTGKTYTIAHLYLRLLVEHRLEPGQILVVTYTEAATKELHSRIRQRIREALNQLDGIASTDQLLADLCTRWTDPLRSRQHLELALAAFDTAAIFTIHGFCLRALQDHAFESGARFDTELLANQRPLVQEIVEDFWRTQFFGNSPHLLEAAVQNGYTPDSLTRFCCQMLNGTDYRIVPEATTDQSRQADQIARDLHRQICQVWQAERSSLVTLFREHKGLSRAEAYYRPDQLEPLFNRMDQFIAQDIPYRLFKDFGKFMVTGIQKGTKSTGTPPDHSLFALCEQLKKLTAQRLTMLKADLLTYCRQQLEIRKQQQNIRLFDDLLQNLHQALSGSTGKLLSSGLQSSYRAALIDEFQDTDPTQYRIFCRLYQGATAPRFLIGDPKQAIYSFRGADIFAYLQAASDVAPEQRFTLTRNWRSTPRLLTACNLLFSRSRLPFLFEQISYQPVSAGQMEDSGLQIVHDSCNAPLQFLLLPQESLSATAATRLIPGLIATEISSLLTSGQATINQRGLMPSDIAVIVRTNLQARQIRNALNNLGIPATLRGDSSLFATDEARALCTLLLALLEPGKEALLRAALTSTILGWSGSQIADLQEQELEWEAVLDRFRQYHQTWHEQGFMVMSRLLLSGESVREHLLRHTDGERQLTNLLHCFELLHNQSLETGSGMAQLVRWFCEKVADPPAGEEYELRLETDEQAVKILTVHVSKGLEFPVVFCPYLWNGFMEPDDILNFHDQHGMVRDFGSDRFAAHREQAAQELLAEGLRLFYVAVTRAKYRCYLLDGKFERPRRAGSNDPSQSALAYLVHSTEEVHTSNQVVTGLSRQYARLSHIDIQNQLQMLSDQSGGTIGLRLLPEQPVAVRYQPPTVSASSAACRQFNSTILHDWRVTSFSAFSSGYSQQHELPDRDEHISSDSLEIIEKHAYSIDIFNFPKGATAGVCIHALFEQLDFSNPTCQQINQLVADNLERYGFDLCWQPVLQQMVNHVIQTSLTTRHGTLKLSDLTPGSWLTELEFFFPLQPLTTEKLVSCLGTTITGSEPTDLQKVLGTLNFKPVRGMVRGFMDMVFEHNQRYYLLDWKSNHLGIGVQAYHQAAMQTEMEHNRYPLQYLLYTVALNQYLKLRIPTYRYNENFGGVLYLFVRGMHPDSGEPYGIFYDLPDEHLVDSLSSILLDSHLP